MAPQRLINMAADCVNLACDALRGVDQAQRRRELHGEAEKLGARVKELSDEVETGVNNARSDTNNFLRGLENDPALIRGLKKIERGLESVKNNLR